MEKRDAQNKVLLLMACSLVFRIVTATTIELGNDEVYYALYPRYPAWSYFDHPAMIAWVVRILNLGHVPHTAWALRLPALLFGTLNLYLAFLIGTLLKNPRCGFYSALLYAASLYVSVICGVFILPDTAQSFFWLLSLLVLVRIFHTQRPARLWLLFGLTAGLAVLSKYHGVFLWAGAGLYILLRDRERLRNPFLYLGALISLLCLFPIIYWNSQHAWASFVYHGSRTLGHQALINWGNVVQEIGGEFFYNSLPVVALIVIALLLYRRTHYLENRKFVWLLCMSIPLIAFVWIMSGRRETLPHWTGPSYLSLMFLPAAWLSERRKAATPVILWVCLGFTGLLMILGLVEINTGFLNLTGDKPALTKDYQKDDFTLDMYGWQKTQVLTDSVLTNLVRNDALSPDYQFLQVNWYNGAHVDFYISRPMRRHTLVLGPLKNIHQFYWVNQSHNWDQVTDYCLVTNSREYQDLGQLPPFFQKAATRTDTLPLYRDGHLAEVIFLTVFRQVPADSVKAWVDRPYEP